MTTHKSYITLQTAVLPLDTLAASFWLSHLPPLSCQNGTRRLLTNPINQHLSSFLTNNIYYHETPIPLPLCVARPVAERHAVLGL
jgi:hypothetical protein